MRVLVTGAAGFVGAATTQKLLDRGDDVVGMDNLNPYYDPKLKADRIERLSGNDRFEFIEMDCADQDGMAKLFQKDKFDTVVHLAAQAGVRYSLEHPFAYLEANLNGFLTVLEGCRHQSIKHLVYASSSSVYGQQKLPFSVETTLTIPFRCTPPQKSNEHMGTSTPTSMACRVRDSVLYGVWPWGRPDMALFRFVESILKDEPIQVFGGGEQTRDFTYIDDIVEGVLRTLDTPATGDGNWDPSAPNLATSAAPWRVFNIGGGRPIPLLQFIACIEDCLQKKAVMEFLPMQPGDVRHTEAMSKRCQKPGYTPSTPIDVGIPGLSSGTEPITKLDQRGFCSNDWPSIMTPSQWVTHSKGSPSKNAKSASLPGSMEPTRS